MAVWKQSWWTSCWTTTAKHPATPRTSKWPKGDSSVPNFSPFQAGEEVCGQLQGQEGEPMDWPDKVSTYEPDMDMAHYRAQAGYGVHMHALSNCPPLVRSQIWN